MPRKQTPQAKTKTEPTPSPDPTEGGPRIRLEWVEAGSLKENPNNWRRHSTQQMEAIRSVIDDPAIGWAGALLFNETTGRLIDGHARRDAVAPDTPVPVLIGRWDERAERKILATLDPIGGMATADRQMFSDLVADLDVDSLELRDLIDRIEASAVEAERDGKRDDDDDQQESDDLIPEMTLRPFEHYDYVVVLANNTPDWEALCEFCSLSRVNASPIPGKKKIGLGRAITASALLAAIQRVREGAKNGVR